MKPSPALDATSSRLFDLPPNGTATPSPGTDGPSNHLCASAHPHPRRCAQAATPPALPTPTAATSPPLILHGTGHGRTASGWDLVAMRCPHCHHDQVIELRDSFNVWDLDDNDYTPEGSWE